MPRPKKTIEKTLATFITVFYTSANLKNLIELLFIGLSCRVRINSGHSDLCSIKSNFLKKFNKITYAIENPEFILLI